MQLNFMDLLRRVFRIHKFVTVNRYIQVNTVNKRQFCTQVTYIHTVHTVQFIQFILFIQFIQFTQFIQFI